MRTSILNSFRFQKWIGDRFDKSSSHDLAILICLLRILVHFQFFCLSVQFGGNKCTYKAKNGHHSMDNLDSIINLLGEVVQYVVSSAKIMQNFSGRTDAIVNHS